MKKISMILLAVLLLLSGCSKTKTRTDVVDVLIDNGFSRNSNVGNYVKTQDNYKLKIGYMDPGYTNAMLSVQDYYSEGPIAILDYTGDAYFWFMNNDAYGFSRICSQDEKGNNLATEALYFYDLDKWVVGYDYCELLVDDDTSSIEDIVKENGNSLKTQIEKLNLTIDEFSLIGE